MSMNLAFFAVAALVFLAVGRGPIPRSTTWRAMIAPLASIIGSGFLVSAPLLGRELGGAAVLGIAGLTLYAWFIGSAIRYNIAHVEPLLEGPDTPARIQGLERLSALALFFAYVVSVAYYLALLGAFVMKLVTGGSDPMAAKIIATALLALIGWLGWSGGLRKVIAVESTVVAIKLAVIGGFLGALALHVWMRAAAGESVAPPPVRGDWGTVPVLLGLLIVVQGFETSRFLGEEFDRPTRIRTMKLAQLVAAGIYILFFALLSPLLETTIEGTGETAIMDAAAALTPLLPIALTLGAVASQFSAAVADAIGGAGLAHGAVKRIDGREAYPLLVFVSALVLWETDIYAIISLASRAFAIYYMLQCALAAVAAVRVEGWTPAALGHAGMAAGCAAIALFGAPAE